MKTKRQHEVPYSLTCARAVSLNSSFEFSAHHIWRAIYKCSKMALFYSHISTIQCYDFAVFVKMSFVFAYRYTLRYKWTKVIRSQQHYLFDMLRFCSFLSMYICITDVADNLDFRCFQNIRPKCKCFLEMADCFKNNGSRWIYNRTEFCNQYTIK